MHVGETDLQLSGDGLSPHALLLYHHTLVAKAHFEVGLYLLSAKRQRGPLYLCCPLIYWAGCTALGFWNSPSPGACTL